MRMKLFKIFKELSLTFTEHQHQAMHTCEESKNIKITFPGIPNKTLFLKDIKNNKYFLAIIPCQARLNFEKISRQFSCARLTFAVSRELKEILGLYPGSVSPFGLIHNTNFFIQFMIDKKIWDEKYVQFHPCINTSTIVMKTKD